VVCLLSGDNRRVAREHEVDPGIRDKIRLELRNVHVECAIEAERSRERRDDLTQEPVEIRVCRAFNIEITPADIVKRLIINHVGYIRVLKQRVHAEDRIVRFYDPVAT